MAASSTLSDDLSHWLPKRSTSFDCVHRVRFVVQTLQYRFRIYKTLWTVTMQPTLDLSVHLNHGVCTTRSQREFATWIWSVCLPAISNRRFANCNLQLVKLQLAAVAQLDQEAIARAIRNRKERQCEIHDDERESERPLCGHRIGEFTSK